MRQRLFFVFLLTIGIGVALGWPTLAAQSTATEDLLSIRAAARIHRPIDDTERVVLPGNHPKFARPELATGAVSPDTRLERMILVLSPAPHQKQALVSLLAAQQDPSANEYHRWLTPDEFGLRFGVDDADLRQVTAWLGDHGFTVESVSSSRNNVVFSGSASQVQAAFHTAMNHYQVAGQSHAANANDPEIPAALAGIVEGVVSLHDFRTRPVHSARRVVPLYTNAGGHYLSPADFATIYDLGTLYQQYTDGTGQSIAVVGRSNLVLSDVRQFRSAFGLPARDPVVLLNGRDPGTAASDDFKEATLDVEWAGAVAKNASIQFVTTASTNVTDGIYLSAQFAVDHDLAPVLSMSYGLCESSLGNAENTFVSNLWQQAAAQGITVVVSSGDSGAAGCDSVDAPSATKGRAVNGLCSTPYNTCVGGTQFDDTDAGSLYWNGVNDASGSSARSYIPERTWNESGGSGLWSSGGGASTLYAKPSWQTSAGVPPDGMRDVPDVSLAAAGHTAYLVFVNGNKYGFSGTSAATPAFAALMALVNQSSNSRQGNVNAALYRLAAQQQAGMGSAVFHDIVAGNNSVPGLTGFQASAGYDRATGLGSVDAFELVTHWNESNVVPNFTLSASATSIALQSGGQASSRITITGNSTFSSSVQLAVSGVPAGMFVSFAPAVLAAPGSGASSLLVSVSPQVVPGTYPLIVTATGAGVSHSVTLTVQISSFSVTLSGNNVALSPGGTTILTFSIAGQARFHTPVALSIAGLPAGVTYSVRPAGVVLANDHTGLLVFAASATAPLGSRTVLLTAFAGGVFQTIPLLIQVNATSTLRLPAPVTILIRDSARTLPVSTPEMPLPREHKLIGSLAGAKVTFSPPLLLPPCSSADKTLPPSSSALLGSDACTEAEADTLESLPVQPVPQ